MARSFNGSSQYLEYAGAVNGNNYPISFGAWFRSDDITAGQSILFHGNSGSASQYKGLNASGGITGDPVSAFSRDVTSTNVDTTTGYSANTWHHGLAVFDGINDRRVYIDGGSKNTSTIVKSPSVNRTTIGALNNGGTLGSYFSGYLAEVAMWTTTLTDADALMLGKGVSPLMVKPRFLIAYWPLIGRNSPETDIINGYDMTLYNTPTAAPHPPISYPLRWPISGLRRSTSGYLFFKQRRLLSLQPTLAVPTASSYATLGLRNQHTVLQFDDASDESTVFSTVMPQVYSSGDLALILRTSGATATSGYARLGVALERIGDGQQDVDSDSFSDHNAKTYAIPSTSGYVTETQINFLSGIDMDSIAAGEKFRIKVTRFGSDANDDMSGDLELHNIDLVEVS